VRYLATNSVIAAALGASSMMRDAATPECRRNLYASTVIPNGPRITIPDSGESRRKASPSASAARRSPGDADGGTVASVGPSTVAVNPCGAWENK
jgi:hypothetical protein